MNSPFFKTLKMIVLRTFRTEAVFYRQKYLKAGLDLHQLKMLSPERFNTLPVITNQELMRAPYSERRYQKTPGFHRLVYSEEASRFVLFKKAYDEIREASLPQIGKRPLVLFSNIYDAIEISLFFYAHNYIPLMGEFYKPDVVIESARQYSVDALVADHTAFAAYRRRFVSSKVSFRSLVIVDSKFYPHDFVGLRGTKKNFILAIPEMGNIAYACPHMLEQKKCVLHPYRDIYIEEGSPSLITSIRPHATPFVRYQTSINLHIGKRVCSCRKPSLYLSK